MMLKLCVTFSICGLLSCLPHAAATPNTNDKLIDVNKSDNSTQEQPVSDYETKLGDERELADDYLQWELTKEKEEENESKQVEEPQPTDTTSAFQALRNKMETLRQFYDNKLEQELSEQSSPNLTQLCRYIYGPGASYDSENQKCKKSTIWNLLKKNVQAPMVTDVEDSKTAPGDVIMWPDNRGSQSANPNGVVRAIPQNRDFIWNFGGTTVADRLKMMNYPGKIDWLCPPDMYMMVNEKGTATCKKLCKGRTVYNPDLAGAVKCAELKITQWIQHNALNFLPMTSKTYKKQHLIATSYNQAQDRPGPLALIDPSNYIFANLRSPGNNIWCKTLGSLTAYYDPFMKTCKTEGTELKYSSITRSYK
eukprot:GHVL01024869.1.p1 GENE.GHVL01024869.1~~GHVL01024869.1.p1  ORF type:complete len:365 (-),score=49.37 GHVL01024869.1:389-1483(-)